jgi:hypothetical protein
VKPNKHRVPCHKRATAIVIECVEPAILAAFLRHLRASFAFWASVDVMSFKTKSQPDANQSAVTRPLLIDPVLNVSFHSHHCNLGTRHI